jgi:hypothetical protein
MAHCCICGAETQLYSSGSPVCIVCSETNEARRKPPQASSLGFPETNTRLNAARLIFEQAVQAQREAAKRAEALGAESEIAALQNANRELEFATAAYREALRAFHAGASRRGTG